MLSWINKREMITLPCKLDFNTYILTINFKKFGNLFNSSINASFKYNSSLSYIE